MPERSMPGRVGSRLAEYGGLLPAALLFGGLFGFAFATIALYSVWDIVDYEVVSNWTFDNYTYLFSVDTYVRTALATFWMAGLASVMTLLIAFPFAYWLTRYVSPAWRKRLLLAIVLPFFASYLLRVYAWLAILGENGVINQFLRWTGIADEPVRFFLNDRPAVIVVLIYVYFPFAVLALYVALEEFDWNLLRAARDLGASGIEATGRVLMPLIRPGIVTALIFTFVPMLGEYVTPLLVGGTKGVMFGNLVQNFFQSGEYTSGAAAALILAAIIIALLLVFRRSLALAKS